MTLPHKCSARRYSKEWRTLFSTFNPAGPDHWKRVLPLLLAVPLAGGCVEEREVFPLDPDQDGFTFEEEEAAGCDDPLSEDGTIFPGAPELCDGKDNNCDGVKETDNDGDEHFSNTEEIECGDCDDGNADVHPNATEEPGDGIDNNCDGEAELTDTATELEEHDYIAFGSWGIDSFLGTQLCIDSAGNLVFHDLNQGLMMYGIGDALSSGDLVPATEHERLGWFSDSTTLGCLTEAGEWSGRSAVSATGGTADRIIWGPNLEPMRLTHSVSGMRPAPVAVGDRLVLVTDFGIVATDFPQAPSVEHVADIHTSLFEGPNGSVRALAADLDANNDGTPDLLVLYANSVRLFDGAALEYGSFDLLLRMELDFDPTDAAVVLDTAFDSAPEIVVVGVNHDDELAEIAVISSSLRGHLALDQVGAGAEPIRLAMPGVSHITLTPMLTNGSTGRFALGFPTSRDEVWILRENDIRGADNGSLLANPALILRGDGGFGWSLDEGELGGVGPALCVGAPFKFDGMGEIACIDLASWL